MPTIIKRNGIIIDLEAMTIRHDDVTTYFFSGPQYTNRFRNSNLAFRAAVRLIISPATNTELFQYVYDEPEDGGPDSGPRIMDVVTSRLRKQLAAIGLKVHHGSSCRDNCYYEKWIAP